MLKSRTARLTGLATVLMASLGQQAFAESRPVKFKILIENVSTSDTLKLPDGTGIRAPIAPGAYAVFHDDAPIFRPGQPAGSAGLEPLAEDGNAGPMIASLATLQAVHMSGMFVPGQSFEITAKPGERLAFATMFVQSNDLFFGPKEGGIALFDASGDPISGDVTAEVDLLDAGTEVNQAPGTGSDQAPRQAAPDTGASETGGVAPVSDSFRYPAASVVIRVTIEPQPMPGSS